MSTPRILALDIATKTGWAHSDGTSGTWILKTAKQTPMDRINNVWHKLRTAHLEHPFDVLVAEDVHVRHVSAAKPLCELRGAVMAWCGQMHIPFVGNIAPTVIKKFATGKGNASKEEMVAAASVAKGWQQIKSEDEADAICLLFYYQRLTREGSTYVA